MPQPAVELYQTQERANAMAKDAAACAGSGADFAVRRMTAAAFVAELWKLWGDGRVLVDATQRIVLVSHLLEGQNSVAPSAGAARQLASFFRGYASLLERWSAGAGANVSSHEQAVLEMGHAYGEELAGHSLVEPDAAAAQLARLVAKGELPVSDVRVVDAIEPTPGFVSLLKAYAATGASVTGLSLALREGEEAAVVIPPLDADVEPLFLVPTGPTATASMMHDFLLQAHGAGMGSVLVCGPNASQLAETLLPSLAERGILCAERVEVPVRDTFTARLWEALENVLAGRHAVASATDAALNLLAGLGRGDARDLNTELRRDRTITSGQVAARLREASPLCGAVMDALGASGSVSFDALTRAADALAEAIQGAPALAPLQRKQESVLVATLADTIEQVRALKGEVALVPELWLQGSVRVEAQAVLATIANASADNSDDSAPMTVEFASPYRLNSLIGHSYDAVLLSDVSNDAFCARAGSTALDELAQKLGWAVPVSPFNRQRRRFIGAMSAARRQFACLVPQRTPAGEEAYPAFLLKEYIEALSASRASNAQASEADDNPQGQEETSYPLGLPEALKETVIVRGEDDLVETVGAVFASVLGKEELPGMSRGVLEYLPLERFLLHAGDGIDEKLVMSPSAIEAYLGCPYSWFIQRRVGQRSLDEDFGPREEGSFAHAVLAAFYEELAAQGRHRVGKGAWADDERILAQVFKKQVEDEKGRDPGSGRLVAISSAEGLKLRQLYRALADSLRRQGSFAPGFVPMAHERAIDLEDGVDYAGIRLRGQVDRIDVNEQTSRYLVVDYKGSLGSEYNLGTKKDTDPALPGRLQALMYAQALRSQLDALHCAGALYLNYRAKQDSDMVLGAVDGSQLEDAFIKGSSVSPLNFDALLDFVEAQVAEALQGLQVSLIPQHARYAAACRYCPVPDCAGRLA